MTSKTGLPWFRVSQPRGKLCMRHSPMNTHAHARTRIYNSYINTVHFFSLFFSLFFPSPPPLSPPSFLPFPLFLLYLLSLPLPLHFILLSSFFLFFFLLPLPPLFSSAAAPALAVLKRGKLGSDDVLLVCGGRLR